MAKEISIEIFEKNAKQEAYKFKDNYLKKKIKI